LSIKKIRQILKSFADDTRLRIINLLSHQEMSVSELCLILNVSQSSLSKHLGRLRLTGIVNDRRGGMNVYYSLVEPKEKAHKELLNAITAGLAESEAFVRDSMKLKEIHGDKKPKGARARTAGRGKDS